MTLVINTLPVPLLTDNVGVVRIRGSRVTLDTIVTAFNEGNTAEEIIQQYPTLSLADVYSVIGYYLNNHSEVEAYLETRQEKATAIRIQNEKRFDPQGIRERLIARIENPNCEKVSHKLY